MLLVWKFKELEDCPDIEVFRMRWDSGMVYMVARIIKELDPNGVKAWKARWLHHWLYRSQGANARWHVDVGL